MGTITILPETTRNPITLMGERAGVCWGANTDDSMKNYKRGLDCIESGHGRVLEYVNVEMILDGYSARVMREWYTHIGGAPTRLQESTRYIDYAHFNYVIPRTVQGIGRDIYEARMADLMDSINALVEEHNVPREDAAMLLPLGMCTRVVDKRNLRNLIDMSRQRMCQRAFWEFREMFDDIWNALCNYSKEWKTVVHNTFRPKCYDLGYCPEKNGCGRYPRKGGNGNA